MEFLILGPLEVVADGRQIAVAGAKQRALLAMLLLHANEVVSRDRLIDELWDSSPPETASTALQVHVSQLRKALGRETIATRAPGYVVNVEPGELDREHFERLVAEAHDQGAAQAAETLREALGLWRGPPLADLDDSFARPERAQLEEQRLSALDRRIEAELELGLHAQLLPQLEARVREDPLRERPRAQLMLALYRSGRQAEALEVYRAGRRQLAEELGLEPGQELRDLEKAILEHDPSLAAPAESPRTARKPTLTAEERRLRLMARSRWAIAVGALLLAGAVAGIVLAVTGGSAPSVPVASNSVAVLDPKTGRVTADVPIGGRPVAIAIGAGSVWVVNADDQTVLRIDPKTDRVVKVIGGLGQDPSDIAYGSGSIWVAGGDDGTLIRIDPRLNAPEAPVDLGPVGGLPQPVTYVTTGEGMVWATRGNRLLRIDPRLNAMTANVEAPHPQGIAAGVGSAWVTKVDEHLLRVDASSATPTEDLDLSHGVAFPVVFSGSLWLDVYPQRRAQPAQVWRLNPSTLEQTELISVPAGFLFGLAAGDGALWAADHDRGVVWRIDPTTHHASRLARVGHHPIAIAQGESAIWVGVQARPFS